MINSKFKNRRFSLCVNSLKLCIYILLFGIYTTNSVFAGLYSQNRIQLKFNNTPINNVINFIENNSSYRFLYQINQVETTKLVSIDFEGPVNQAVQNLFSKTNVHPVVIKNQIILKERLLDKQERVLKGVVTDQNNEPLLGVTVLVNEIERGTETDENGKYSITVKEGDILTFTYIGFKRKDIVITDQETLNVQLQEDNQLLEEIVLIGYGTKNKAQISSSISSVNTEVINTNVQSGNSFERGLGGLAKGVYITQGGGRPGSGVNVNIRGVTSPDLINGETSNNNPLFVIDGVQFFGEGLSGGFNPLTSINPKDIEKIDILKDAAATSIYGSRGANGVIIIKTKGGRKNTPIRYNLSTKTTLARPVNTLDYLNAEEYKKFAIAAIKGAVKEANKNPSYRDELNTYQNLYYYGVDFEAPFITYKENPSAFGNADTNWADEVYRNPAITNNYNFSLYGGSEYSSYFLSIANTNQEGLLKNDVYKQTNIRLSLDVDLSEKVRLGTSITIANSTNRTGHFTYNGDLNSRGLNFRPDLPVYDAQGKYNTTKGLDVFTLFNNPVVITTESNKGKEESLSLIGNIFAEVDVFKGFTLKTSFNTQITHFDSDSFLPSSKQETQRVFGTSTSYLTEISNRTKNFVVDVLGTYKTKIGKSSVQAMFGFTNNITSLNNAETQYEGFPDEEVLISREYARTVTRKLGGRPNESGINSWLSRLVYSYNDTYGITATLRSDSSTKFAKDKRTAYFPSISGYWNINKESFLSDSKVINKLKLRLSYGHTGSTNVPDFSYLSYYTTNKKYGDKLSIAPSDNLPNKKLGWETTREYNAGIDYELFRNKITGSVDFYRKKTYGALSPTYYSLETGKRTYISNSSDVLNKGFEIDLNAKIINKADLSWSIGGNISKNINKVVSLDESLKNVRNYAFSDIIEGEETGLIKGFLVEKIFQTDSEVTDLNDKAGIGKYYYRPSTGAGDFKFKDVSGPSGKPDGIINEYDKVILGSSHPDFFGGFNTLVRYKRFELGAFFNYSYGVESIRNNETFSFNATNVQKNIGNLDNRWSEDNKKAYLPKLIVGSSPNNISNERIVYDASYIRFKTLSLSYSLPQYVSSNLYLNNVKFILSASNLYTWTDFPGLDPEALSSGLSSRSGVNNSDPYPIARTISLGIDINF